MRHQRGRLVYKCLKPAVASLRNEIAALQAKCTDLERRSRRSNVRLVGIPEGMEGTQPTKFIAEARKKYSAFVNPRFWLEPIVHWQQDPRRVSSHGSFHMLSHDLTSRRTFFGGHSNQTAQIQERTVYIFPHFPPEIAKKRAAYYDVKWVLRSRFWWEYGLRGLTGFRITHGGVEHKFDTTSWSDGLCETALKWPLKKSGHKLFGWGNLNARWLKLQLVFHWLI